jgi:hypothetical protein
MTVTIAIDHSEGNSTIGFTSLLDIDLAIDVIGRLQLVLLRVAYNLC